MRLDRILIVDDSPTTLMWQQLLLRLEGYATLSASDTADGVRIARAERPDLIVIDVSSIAFGGFEACRALRTATETMNTPILATTTRTEAAHVIEGFESGCNEFLNKPFERTEYLSKVRNQLSRHLQLMGAA